MRFIFMVLSFTLLSSFSFANEASFKKRIEIKKQELSIKGSAETGLAKASSDFEEYVSSNRANRAKRWSMHYYDTRIAFDRVKVRYITRTSNGTWINKIDKHDDMPDLGKNDSYLGRIEMTDGQPEALVHFYPANSDLQTYELPYNKLVEIPELNMSFWRRGDEQNPSIRLHNYERPFADLFANPQFYDYNSSFRVEALYSPYPEPISIDVINSSGGIDEGELRHGFIEFMMNGKYYKLFVYDNEQIRFTDDAEGAYPGGRYLYPEDDDLKKQVFFLDFNRSHAPPCAYSQAYTCSLPMPEEHIGQPVKAGRIYPLNFVK